MHSWYHVKRCWKVYLSDWMSLYYAIKLSAWETTNMKKKSWKLYIKRFSNGENADEMQMPMRDIS